MLVMRLNIIPPISSPHSYHVMPLIVTLLHKSQCMVPLLLHITIALLLLVIEILLRLPDPIVTLLSSTTNCDMILTRVLLTILHKAMDSELHVQFPSTQQLVLLLPLLLSMVITLLWICWLVSMTKYVHTAIMTIILKINITQLCKNISFEYIIKII